MIETMILGFLLGVLCTGAGAAYAAHKFFNEPYFMKKFPSGYSILGCDINTENDPSGYIGIKKDGKLIAGMKFDKEGITDIVYDI
jgi:hypothetical protein